HDLGHKKQGEGRKSLELPRRGPRDVVLEDPKNSFNASAISHMLEAASSSKKLVSRWMRGSSLKSPYSCLSPNTKTTSVFFSTKLTDNACCGCPFPKELK